MNILVAGDLVPTKTNEHLFIQGNITELLGVNLESIWLNADFRIFNLEVPLIDREYPIQKNGPNLIAPTSTITGIKKLNPTVLTLANNHIMDQGFAGLKSTMKILENNGIKYIGAGKDLSKASEPYTIYYENKKIGVYACSEREFSIATENQPGANPFDPLESLDHIQKLKEQCDFVIVLYHGGKEHYPYPSPNLQRVCRKIVDKGADVVICQHSHCIGCKEEYNGSFIVYGQGNFIFDKSKNELWNTSLLINISLDDTIKIEYIPIIRKKNGIRLATGKEADDILSGFNSRSEEILKSGYVEEKFRLYAISKKEFYLRKFAGFGKWGTRIDRVFFKGKLLKKRYKNAQLLALQNYIQCEAHSELVLAVLKGEIDSETK